MNILGIESSCDETAAAVVADGARILSSEIASQVEIHARYGGVVPEVASRQHILSIIPVVQQAMEKAGVGWADLGAIAVTRGPGLAGSLLVGVNAAKALAFARGLPLVGVNHLEGHIYANWLLAAPVRFPALCLVVSGGHSDLILMRDHGDYTLVGRTRDDAAGEAFDKAARILGLGYPGGPAVERAAAGGVSSVPLPNASLRDTFDFSFSGVKTSLVRLVSQGGVSLDDVSPDGRPSRNDAAASFQEAVVEALVSRTVEAARVQCVRQVLLAGGVAANRLLRQRLQERSPYPVLVPPLVLCTDNAAMVAACGYYRFQAGKIDGLDLDVVPALSLV